MAPLATELATLRALSFRISSTPTAQLPQHVPAIAASLTNCRALLSTPQSAGVKATSSEASVAVHKYRTLLSALLQDRTVQGRWSAIVLVKATIELGGWETLQKCLPWVRGLLGFLNKPDPPSTKKLCIITLTRIFMLTKEFPSIVRDVTTPSLPAFIQSCLQIANSNMSTHVLHVVLESFNELLPRHPAIFRPFLKQLHPLLARLIAPTPSSTTTHREGYTSMISSTSPITVAARRLYTQLSSSAPKGASSEEWRKSFKSLVHDAHRVADKVFRAVLEDWQTSTRELAPSNGNAMDDEVQELDMENTLLPPWSGIFAGSERLSGLLCVLQSFLESPSAGAIYLDLAMLMDLISRTLSLTVPALASKSMQHAMRPNNQISKEERENLWLVLPAIHVSAIQLLLSLAQRVGSITTAMDSVILDQLTWLFAAERDTASVRTAIYVAVAKVLARSGKALPKSTIDSLVPIIRTCCDDLLPPKIDVNTTGQVTGQKTPNGKSQPQMAVNADAILRTSKACDGHGVSFGGLIEAAQALLPNILASTRAQYLSDSLRARLDRTAVLTEHKDAMLASVLNPPPSKKFGKPAASILPLLARSFPEDKLIEGLLRPRVPVIRLGAQDVEPDEDMEERECEEEELEQQDEMDASPEQVDDSFVGNELDTILENAGQSERSLFYNVPTASIGTESTTTPKTQVAAPDALSDGGDAVKRALETGAPLSPAKRAKLIGGEHRDEPVQKPVSATATRSSSRLAAAAVPATPTPTITSAVSAPSEPPTISEAATATGDSDDDDDVIPLVFGQDSEDESE